MIYCTYCGVPLETPTRSQLPNEETQDHIFPLFLGGHLTVSACRACNSTFGHTFEGKAAQSLGRLYVQLAIWGVPLPETNQWWTMAYETDGAVIDLSVGSQGIKARANRPIIIRDEAARIEEAYFASDAGLKEFSQAMERRRPGTRWAPAEKIVKTDLRGLRLRFEVGQVWQQAALKMCLAGSTLLPAVSREDRIPAGKILRGPIIDPHPIASQYFYLYPSVEKIRPQLAHTLYVEHLGNTLRGIVQFFGTFQIYCELSTQTQSCGRDAVLGWVDPIDVCESMRAVEPIGLSEPPPYFDLIRAQLVSFRQG